MQNNCKKKENNMPLNKNITIIVSDENVDPFPQITSTLHPYIEMKNLEMRKYVKRTTRLLNGNKLPVSKCVKLIHLESTQNPVFLVEKKWTPLHSAVDDKLTIRMIQSQNCNCGCYNCAEQLRSGHCKDEFVIKTIGKIFFPGVYNKYR